MRTLLVRRSPGMDTLIAGVRATGSNPARRSRRVVGAMAPVVCVSRPTSAAESVRHYVERRVGVGVGDGVARLCEARSVRLPYEACGRPIAPPVAISHRLGWMHDAGCWASKSPARERTLVVFGLLSSQSRKSGSQQWIRRVVVRCACSPVRRRTACGPHASEDGALYRQHCEDLAAPSRACASVPASSCCRLPWG